MDQQAWVHTHGQHKREEIRRQQWDQQQLSEWTEGDAEQASEVKKLDDGMIGSRLELGQAIGHQVQTDVTPKHA
jgi:hypothetical protein